MQLLFGFVVWLVLLPVAVPVAYLLRHLPPKLGDVLTVDPAIAGDSVWLFVVGIPYTLWVLWMAGGEGFKARVSAALAPVFQHDRMAAMGKGGSARFAGLLDEWAHIWRPGSVRLGRSMFDDALIGLDDDRGLLTIASNRSGKGRAAIIPNLLTWPGSVVVVDPKGTNAAVTAARRGKGGGRVTESLGQPVHVLDPFGIVAGVQSAAFNPLSSVDLAGNRAKEDIGLIADALVVPSGPGDSHWDEGARSIIAGVIAHLLGVYASPLRVMGHDKKMPSLVDVRAALRQDPDGLDSMFGAMMKNPVAGGLAQAAAALVSTAGPNERGSLFTTALRNTAWLDSVAMAGVLGQSDFKMSDLKAAPMSVYVVLPPDLLDEHSRFMRLFVNLTVRAASQGGKSRVPILLVMDEFYSLGSLGSLAKASGALAGYGLKLWPILQNLSQLRELYPQNWQTFFANAGAVQIFGVNDRGTAQEIVATLGQAVWLETVDARQMKMTANLLEAAELEQLTERGSGLQVVLRSGRSPLLLKKTNYDQDPDFSRSMYAADPDHDGS
ncbi:type IV secretory system conjugative DNA transfer family protein [Microvirga sesbaniae]|uniref:type IV secretory system conjugative DNA transfer family protein n=1 Tax=Microvirga sesbaniae TaxID=681392 RepID=UPI0021C75559|nr:type IV secretory system conjugative DNA transfer family protein [Microvirga sp. HBU67692]